MTRLKRILRRLSLLLIPPAAYLACSLVLSAVTVDRQPADETPVRTVYLTTNGVHLNIILPADHMGTSPAAEALRTPDAHYLSFGWGDEAFYLNTPTWADLTFANAFRALFLKSPALMHVTRHRRAHNGWLEVAVTETELESLRSFIFESFSVDDSGAPILLPNAGYTANDDFYKAEGSYTLFYTCNTWVNSAFRQTGLKACLWTPYDFPLINKYK